MNILHRGADSAFLSKLDGLEAKLSFRLPALRAENRPVNYVREKLTKGSSKTRKGSPSKCQRPQERAQWVKARNKTIEGWSSPPKQTLMHARTSAMKKNIDELIESGTLVYLVKFPIHPDIEQTAYVKQATEVREALFPHSNYNWVEVLPDDLVWRDGIHMENASTYEFVKRLFEEEAVREILGDIQPAQKCVN